MVARVFVGRAPHVSPTVSVRITENKCSKTIYHVEETTWVHYVFVSRFRGAWAGFEKIYAVAHTYYSSPYILLSKYLTLAPLQ